MKLKLILFLSYSVVTFCSCNKDFESVPQSDIKIFLDQLELKRNHVLILADSSLWFMKDDTISNTFKLNTRKGEIHKMCLSPEGKQAAYLDKKGQVHVIETKKFATDVIIPNMGDSLISLHWTSTGELYGFNAKGKLFSRNGTLEQKEMGLKFEEQFPDTFHDAVYMPDGTYYFSKTFYVSPFDNPSDYGYRSYSFIIEPNDSIAKEYIISDIFPDPIISYLTNKEGELIAVSENENRKKIYNALTLDGSKISNVLFSRNKKFRSSYKNYMTYSTITDSNKIFFRNDLIDLGYETIASSVTYSYTDFNQIQDFDIQMPYSEYRDLSGFLNNSSDVR